MLIVLALLVLSASAADVIEVCQLQQFGLTDKEEKIATHFDRLIKEQVPIAYECLEFLMQRGFYRTAVEVYEQYFILNSIDVGNQLQVLIENDQSLGNVRELQYIFKHAIAKSSKIQTVQPVYHWAQSRNHTLINVKFSHRIDAPACLNTKVEDIRIENNQIFIRAFGIVSHSPIRYEVTINLYKEIDPSTSIQKHEAVGTMFFNLTKVESNSKGFIISQALWIRLTLENIKVPIWWDLRDQLKQDMEDFVELLEEQSERNENKSEKKYRKIQKQKQQEKERQMQLDKLEAQRQWDWERNQCTVATKRCENGWFQRQ